MGDCCSKVSKVRKPLEKITVQDRANEENSSKPKDDFDKEDLRNKTQKRSGEHSTDTIKIISSSLLPKLGYTNGIWQFTKQEGITPYSPENNLKHFVLENKESKEIPYTPNANKNWDNYFTLEELQHYERLYETEIDDIPEIKKVTNYKKGERIGEGAYGKVFKAFDEVHGRLIAIKEVDLKELSSNELSKINALKSEIDILSRFNHKNIIKYYGSQSTDDYLHIFLEFCIGGSIAKLLGTYKTFPENVIRKYTIQILEGLEYLHSHNIIHRDLKGPNILVDRDGICKLSDFGGSKIMAETLDIKKQKYSFKGTPNWMAPEVVKNLDCTRFSDIWGLGCTIIEMATGEPPYAQYKSPLATLYYLYNISKPPELPSHLTNNCKHFLSCCLRIEPTERLNVYKLLKHPFITGDDVFTYCLNNIQEIQLNNFSLGNGDYCKEQYEKHYVTVNNLYHLNKRRSNSKKISNNILVSKNSENLNNLKHFNSNKYPSRDKEKKDIRKFDDKKVDYKYEKNENTDEQRHS